MENLMNKFREDIVSAVLYKLIQEGKLKEFLDFAREQAKKEGMDSEELMGFFDKLEEEYCQEDTIDWVELGDIIRKCTGNCKFKCFNGDKCIIIENEELTDEECLIYLEEKEPKISLHQLNNALSTIGVKLEFIEAINVPFDLEGFNNYIRFKVVELDT